MRIIRGLIMALAMVLPLAMAAEEATLDELMKEPFARMMWSAYYQGDNEAAKAAAQQAVKANKKNYFAYSILGEISKTEENYADAKKYYDKAMKIVESPSTKAFYNVCIGNLYLAEKKDLAKAAEHFRAAAKDEINAGDAFAGLSGVELAKGDTVMAVRYMDNAISVEPTTSHIISRLIISEEGTDVAALLSQAIENASDEEELEAALLARVKYAAKTGDMNTLAETSVKIFAVNPSDESFLTAAWEVAPGELTNCLEERMCFDPKEPMWPIQMQILMRHADKPVESLKYAIIADSLSNTPYTHEVLGNAYIALCDYPKGIESFRKAPEGSLDHKLGYALFMAGNRPEGLQMVRDFVAQDTVTGIYSANLLANMTFVSGNDSEAAALYERINSELGAPDLPTLVNGSAAMKNLGMTRQSGEWLDMAEKSIVENDSISTTEEMISWLPIIRFRKGDAAGAKKTAAEALSDEKNLNEGSLYNYACYYAQAGNGSRALELLQESLDKGQDPYWAEIDLDLKNIRETPQFKAMIQQAKDNIRHKIEIIESSAKSYFAPAVGVLNQE